MKEEPKTAVRKNHELPVISVFALCDSVIEDKYTNKVSIIGMFDRFIAYNIFPYRHGCCALFVSLINGRGEMPFEWRLTDLQTLATEPLGCGLLRFNDPLAALPIFQVIRPVFPMIGWYSFEFVVAGTVLASKRVQVVQGEIVEKQKGLAP
jgi:hypothetical protein